MSINKHIADINTPISVLRKWVKRNPPINEITRVDDTSYYATYCQEHKPNINFSKESFASIVESCGYTLVADEHNSFWTKNKN